MTEQLVEYDFSDTITLRHMMTMTAGFNQGNPLPPALFAAKDWVEWIVEGPWSPGKLGTFDYYGGDNHAGAEILRRYLSEDYDDVGEFADARLFSRLEIAPTRWDHEPASNVLPTQLNEKVYYGPSQMFMRPRDMARFGQLYLDGGTIDGEEILDFAWVTDTTKDLVAGGVDYGCWWWREYLNGTPVCVGQHCAFHALGYGGQHIYVFPSLDMLVVMTSNWIGAQSGAQISANEGILKTVMSALTD